MLIDVHTHIFPPEVIANREDYLRRDDLFGALYTNPRARLATAEDLIAAMDRQGITAAVACGFGWSDHGLCVAHNDYLIDAVGRYPDRIIGFAAIQPRAARQAVAEVERVVAAGLGGVGELMPHGQGFSLDDEPLLAPLAAAATALGVPILTHTSEPVGHIYPGKGTVTVQTVYHLAVAFPDLRIICGHWGGGLPFYELMPEVAVALRNVYYDSAASPYLYHPRIYTLALELCGVDRILFGSDYPLLRYRRCLDEIRTLGLSPDVEAAVLGGNAARLLGLEIGDRVQTRSGGGGTPDD
jgi:uncharacterized protein